MTVCVGISVNDCLVFAADSASTLVLTDQHTGESSIVNVYQHGDKIYNLYKRLPIAAMTAGMGNIGQESIGTLAKELRRRLTNGDTDWRIDPDNYALADVADKARKLFFEEKFFALSPPPPAPHSFEFWIGGYSSGFGAGPESWKITIVNGSCDPPENIMVAGATGIFLGGQAAPIRRLVVGFDPSLRDALTDSGMDATSASQIEMVLQNRLEVQLVAPTMPIRDAIDLADFLVETTKRFFRFQPGADIVGGETDIAVVTKYEGFKWIRRKHFYPAALNPLETDHA